MPRRLVQFFGSTGSSYTKQNSMRSCERDCSSRSRVTMRTRSPTRSMHISSASRPEGVTRNRLTVEELAKDTLEVRDLNRAAETPYLRPSFGAGTRAYLQAFVVAMHR